RSNPRPFIPLYLVLAILVFFFNDPAPTEIYTLSLHDALPIWYSAAVAPVEGQRDLVHGPAVDHERPQAVGHLRPRLDLGALGDRSEEHTSELQSRGHLVCRLLLEKKKRKASYKPARSTRVA